MAGIPNRIYLRPLQRVLGSDQIMNENYSDIESLIDNDPEASEARLQALAPEISALEGSERLLTAEFYSLLARTQSQCGKSAEAHASLENADQILREPATSVDPAKYTAAKIRFMLEKASYAIVERTPSQAQPLALEAWRLAGTAQTESFAVEAAQLMSLVDTQKAQPEWTRRAIEIAEKSSDKKAKRHLGKLYATQAWGLFEVRQFDKALEILQTSLKHFTEIGDRREIFVAKWSIGKILRVMGKPEEALKIHEELLSEVGAGDKKDGRLYEELAECLHVLKRPGEAQPYFDIAFKELSNDPWVADNEPVALKRMKELGKARY